METEPTGLKVIEGFTDIMHLNNQVGCVPFRGYYKFLRVYISQKPLRPFIKYHISKVIARLIFGRSVNINTARFYLIILSIVFNQNLFN